MKKCVSCLNKSTEFYLCKECCDKIRGYNNFDRHQKSIVLYNDFGKDILWRIKYNNDYELALIFKTRLTFYKIRYWRYIWVCMPNSKKQTIKRKVFVNGEILSACNIKSLYLHKRIDDVIMSKSKQRLTEKLEYEKIRDIKKGKKIIIFDDLITSGNSINCYKNQIKKDCNPKKIIVISLFKAS